MLQDFEGQGSQGRQCTSVEMDTASDVLQLCGFLRKRRLQGADFGLEGGLFGAPILDEGQRRLSFIGGGRAIGGQQS